MELFKIFGVLALKGKKDVDNGLDDTTDKAKDSESKMSAAFKKIGAAVATYFAVDKIVSFGKVCVETAASIQASNSQFQQTFSTGGEDLTSTAKNVLDTIAKSSGILATRLQDSGTKIYAFAKSSGADSATAMQLMQDALTASADSAAYYDTSLENATETMMSFLKGNFANDAALGVSCTETTRNANAMELFGQKYNDLSEIQKQQTLLKMVTDSQKLSGAMGQAARESSGYENVMGNLNESWRQFKAIIGQPMLELVIPLVQDCTMWISNLNEKVSSAGGLVNYLNGYWQKFNDIISAGINWVQQHKTALEFCAIAVGTLTTAIIAYNVAQAIKNAGGIVEIAQLAATAVGIGALTVQETAHTVATNIATVATTAFGTALKFASSTVTLVVLAIGVLVAAGVALYKNWDTVSAFAKSTWGKIKDFMTKPIESAKEKIKEIIDKIKGFFSVKLEFPKIKLPHFGIRPYGWQISDLLKGSIPKLGIEWYAKGAVLNKPSIFSYNPATGNAMGGGEAGPEAVAPISTLQRYVKEAVADENRNFEYYLQKILEILAKYIPELANMQVVLDAEKLGKFVDRRMEEVIYG